MKDCIRKQNGISNNIYNSKNKNVVFVLYFKTVRHSQKGHIYQFRNQTILPSC